MAMDASMVGSSPNRGGMLDQAPPQPPGTTKRATLIDNQMQSGAGIGAEAANPQIVAMQGLALIDQGTKLLSSALPALAPALSGLVANLQQVVPQAMADQLAGINGVAPGAAPDANAAGAGAPPAGPPSGQAAGAGAPPGMA